MTQHTPTLIDAFVRWLSTGNNDIAAFLIVWLICWVGLANLLERRAKRRGSGL
jgi:hypothetical protein